MDTNKLFTKAIVRRYYELNDVERSNMGWNCRRGYVWKMRGRQKR